MGRPRMGAMMAPPEGWRQGSATPDVVAGDASARVERQSSRGTTIAATSLVDREQFSAVSPSQHSA